MSGLAEILHEEGFTISGSDSKESDLTKSLEAKGMRIFYGQCAENIIPGIDLVVYTAAIREDNPEFAAAKAAGLPMLTRAELLGQIMDNYKQSIAVAGTHGKTTTTSMISQILLEAETDPTITVGGILSAIHGNLRVGSSEYFVSEACEYTNSFLNFRPKYSIILNIEAEHLDFFKDLDDIRHSFHKFATNTLTSGATIINGEIDNYEEIVKDLPQQVVTYGFDSKYDFYPENITYNEKACASFSAMHHGQKLFDVTLNVPGAHNISNSLSAIALAIDLGISPDAIISGLSKFGGADRRFQYKGTVNGITIIDDYGGVVKNVSISHTVYNRVTAKMNIASRYDVAKFMKKLENSQSSLLGNATNGYHYHLIEAPSEEILDNIEQKLDETGFLVPWQEWEK